MRMCFSYACINQSEVPEHSYTNKKEITSVYFISFLISFSDRLVSDDCIVPKARLKRTREYMRENRSRLRADEMKEIIIEEQDDDLFMDASNLFNQATACIDIDPIITIDSSVSATRFDSDDEIYSNPGDIIDEDSAGENDDQDVDKFIHFYDLSN